MSPQTLLFYPFVKTAVRRAECRECKPFTYTRKITFSFLVAVESMVAAEARF